MKIIKYGKKSSDIFNIKKIFYSKNNLFLNKQKKIAKLYRKQPIRKTCKACSKKITGDKFINHNIAYTECKHCGHINGKQQDTQKFSDIIYKSKSINYLDNYKSSDLINYKIRKKNIYAPKVKFLQQSIVNWKKLKVLDFGCGSGYLVSSLVDHGFKNVEGFDVSQDQINYGNKILKILNKKKNLLKFVKNDEVLNEIKNTNASCVSLIGVLEHLVNLKDFLNAVKSNKKIKFIYLCVPMFSLSSIVENNFQDVFNRHLGGGHTHLFTEKSLKQLMSKINFYELSSWWFGTDFMDLYRALMVKTEKKKEKPIINNLLKLKNEIDNLQLVLDKKKLSSQVHMILKRKI